MSDSPRRTRAGNIAVDNAQGFTPAKLALRRWALDSVSPARVLDVFAGIDGEMHRGVWRDADEYLGIDERWSPDDERNRLVGDSYKILRSIDLARWNIFDIDCYGMPWEALLVIATRRRWATGEVGAVVCTDSALRSRFGFASHAQVAAVGLTDRKLGTPSAREYQSMLNLGISRWARESGVEILAMQLAEGARAGGAMRYFAITFRGYAANIGN